MHENKKKFFLTLLLVDIIPNHIIFTYNNRYKTNLKILLNFTNIYKCIKSCLINKNNTCSYKICIRTKKI